MGVEPRLAPVPPEYLVEEAPARRRRRRRARRLTAAGAVVLLVLGTMGVLRWQRNSAADAAWRHEHTCPGMDRAIAEVVRAGPECLWAVTEQADIVPGLPARTATVADLIATENRRVRDLPERLPYVRVAVFMPMTTRGPGDALSEAAILHSLQGVYTAQRRANTSPDIVGRAPLFQLTLVNIGRNQEYWPQMADVVETMTADPHPVVAVVGLGVSQRSTEAIGARFSGRLPVVGGALTATSLGGPSFFLASPSNRDYVDALGDYLATRPGRWPGGAPSGVLFQDIAPDDIYVQSLGAELSRRFGTAIGNRRYEFKGSRGTGPQIVNEFGNGRQKVCDYQADAVYFAGRDRDLAQLIRSLVGRRLECGHSKPLLVLSAAPSYPLMETDRVLLQRMRETETTVMDATAAAPRQWLAGTDAPAGFASFHGSFRTETSGTSADLDDGYAIMNHDAMLTVIRAARLSVRFAGRRLPAPGDVITAIRNLGGTAEWAVPGAGGTLAFDDRSGTAPTTATGWPHGWPHGKAVPLLIFPDGAPVTPAYRTP